jgi:hypothetical protein
MPVPRLFKPEMLALYLFFIPWTAFSIFWICGAAGFRLPDFSKGFSPTMLFPLFGLPFLILGLAMLSTPFWSYLKEKKTLYAVTDKRALIITGGRTFEYQTIVPEQILEITRRERGQLGDLIIAKKQYRDSDNDLQTQEIGFFNIAGVREANDSLKKLLQAHAESHSTPMSDRELKDQ